MLSHPRAAHLGGHAIGLLLRGDVEQQDEVLLARVDAGIIADPARGARMRGDLKRHARRPAAYPAQSVPGAPSGPGIAGGAAR